VNLAVFDSDGQPHSRASAAPVQEGEARLFLLLDASLGRADGEARQTGMSGLGTVEGRVAWTAYDGEADAAIADCSGWTSDELWNAGGWFAGRCILSVQFLHSPFGIQSCTGVVAGLAES
jgi:hypothetical protein